MAARCPDRRRQLYGDINYRAADAAHPPYVCPPLSSSGVRPVHYCHHFFLYIVRCGVLQPGLMCSQQSSAAFMNLKKKHRNCFGVLYT